jgi:short-subunit dehydrogenase
MLKYGGVKGETWVIVTGGSDGIGLQMCLKLASLGFNICIVARDEAKMTLHCNDIEQKYSVKTKSIVCDFSKVVSIADYIQVVASQVAELDIAMVFLNAGGSPLATINDLTDEQTQTILRINYVHPIYLTKALLP